jgi:predicted phage tail protein
MTTIKIHGILGKIFGNEIKIHINNLNSALKAIDTNRPGFIKKIYDLSQENYNYHIVVDGETIEDHNILNEKRKINNIDIVPAIYGSGPVAGPAAAILSASFAATVTGQIVGFLINMLIMTAISTGISLLMNLFMKKSSGPTAVQQYSSLAGQSASASINDAERSYVFQNVVNVSNQGLPIPLGYGISKIGSAILNVSVQSYPQNYSISEIFQSNNFTVNSDYLAI